MAVAKAFFLCGLAALSSLADAQTECPDGEVLCSSLCENSHGGCMVTNGFAPADIACGCGRVSGGRPMRRRAPPRLRASGSAGARCAQGHCEDASNCPRCAAGLTCAVREGMMCAGTCYGSCQASEPDESADPSVCQSNDDCCEGVCGHGRGPYIGKHCIQPWDGIARTRAQGCHPKPKKKRAPPHCSSWNDGCNTCTRDSSDEPWGCTEMVCSRQGRQHCRACEAGFELSDETCQEAGSGEDTTTAPPAFYYYQPQPPASKFPASWGEPPEIQTKDYQPLAGGYGHGSSALSHWILRHMSRDRRSGVQYPPAFGPPPRMMTRDLRPLPFGYGRGSGSVAKWLKKKAMEVYGEDASEYNNPFVGMGHMADMGRRRHVWQEPTEVPMPDMPTEVPMPDDILV